jgi:hypothetical protein
LVVAAHHIAPMPGCLLLVLLIPGVDWLVGGVGGWAMLAIAVAILHVTLSALRLLLRDLFR